MLLAELVATSDRVAASRRRLEKIEQLAACLARLAPEEVRAAVGFLAGEPRQGRIGIGSAAVGDVRPPPATAAALTLLDVDSGFERMGGVAGPGSKAARLELLSQLLSLATAAEQHFLRRLLLGGLRQGALEGVVTEAIARAFDVPAREVRRALMLSGDLGQVAAAARAEGRAGLARFRLELFRPLQPMLAQTSRGVEDALTKLGGERAALEWKLDGARVQVHREGGEVRVFTRRLNEVTHALPELVETLRELPGDRIVLDGEVVALRADGRPRPFQVTMRRFGRRRDVEALRRELPLTPFFFDCLHRDGEDLIDRPGAERAAALVAALPSQLVVPRLVTADAEAADDFLAEALARGHEGVMAKSLAAAYEAGRRGSGWLKVKPAHTLDLVVLAVDWGSGRRRGSLSNLHLGARDPATGGFVMLGKTFKGMSDEILAWQTERLQRLAVEQDDWTVRVRPELVVEIACDGVQASPHYPGGVALRFARLVRYRPDKTPAEADTLESVRALLST